MRKSGILAALLLCTALSAAADATLGANDHPIHDLARLEGRQAIEAMLQKDPAARDRRTVQGSTPLHLAAANPDLSALQALLDAGADPNARDGEGATPLHIAAYTQNARHAQRLLEAGADPLAKTNAGRDTTSMARKAMAHEVAGVISLWILKGCQARKPC